MGKLGSGQGCWQGHTGDLYTALRSKGWATAGAGVEAILVEAIMVLLQT